MEEVLEFLKKAGTYYLATDDNGQPRVRPFGTIHQFEGRLYIQTGKRKSVSMLEAYPDLRRMYDPDDGNTEVFYLEDATAVFSSFTAPQRTITF